jgi:aminoglycoside phosphotransferase (APT) family kinase protein
MSTTSNLDRFTREYSQRLGVLTGAQLQAALHRFDLGDLLDAAPVQGGLFGQNVFLTSSKGDYVLRGKPHYPWQLAKERFFSRLIAEQTAVPAAWPYLIETADEPFGWSYAVMPRLPGLQLGDPAVREALPVPDRLAIARALGEALASLKALTWPHPGHYDPAHDTIAARPFDQRMTALAEIDEYIGRCIRLDTVSPADLAWVRKQIAQDIDCLDAPFTPAFVHHDFKEGNAVVERGAEGWRVTGVFDLMEAYFGHPEEDLARPMLDYLPGRPDLARSFVAGYVSGAGLSPGAAGRIRLYMLRDCLLIWWFGHTPGRWMEGRRSFVAWAEPYVSFEPFAA